MEEMPNSPLINVTEVELIYKSKIKASERFKVRSSADSYQLLRQFWNNSKIELQEEFKIMLLNQAGKVLSICNLSSGGITGTVADPKMIFSIALKANAVGIIVAHNHPSGNLTPSSEDILLTKKLKDGAKLLNMSLLDHVIISAEGYYSFADSGVL
jgi:DNA repair protein RadC